MVIARMYGKGQRPLDTDNLYGGCKLLIDAMKAPKGRSRRGLSIIMEDNPKALDLSVNPQRPARHTSHQCDARFYFSTPAIACGLHSGALQFPVRGRY